MEIKPGQSYSSGVGRGGIAAIALAGALLTGNATVPSTAYAQATMRPSFEEVNVRNLTGDFVNAVKATRAVKSDFCTEPYEISGKKLDPVTFSWNSYKISYDHDKCNNSIELKVRFEDAVKIYEMTDKGADGIGKGDSLSVTDKLTGRLTVFQYKGTNGKDLANQISGDYRKIKDMIK